MALPIAFGNTTTAFSDGEFIVAAGTPVSLYITRADDGEVVPVVNFEIAHKTAGGNYVTQLVLNSSNINEKGTVTAAGTWAARRVASVRSAGLEAV